MFLSSEDKEKSEFGLSIFILGSGYFESLFDLLKFFSGLMMKYLINYRIKILTRFIFISLTLLLKRTIHQKDIIKTFTLIMWLV